MVSVECRGRQTPFKPQWVSLQACYTKAFRNRYLFVRYQSLGKGCRLGVLQQLLPNASQPAL